MSKAEELKKEMNQAKDEKKARSSKRFFQAFPGGYGQGDKFLGICVPYQRRIAKAYFKVISLEDLKTLISDPFHEIRLTAIFMLVLKFQSTKQEYFRKKIADFYLMHLNNINNWDLVDSSASYILGAYLYDKERKVLYELATSGNLWKQRISIIATHYFIKKRYFEETIKISKVLLNHEHDLIHKAVGWMLREIGNIDHKTETDFLKEYYKAMPRTMLRYAIEKFNNEERLAFLKGEI